MLDVHMLDNTSAESSMLIRWTLKMLHARMLNILTNKMNASIWHPCSIDGTWISGHSCQCESKQIQTAEEHPYRYLLICSQMSPDRAQTWTSIATKRNENLDLFAFVRSSNKTPNNSGTRYRYWVCTSMIDDVILVIIYERSTWPTKATK